ncbi:hypothetical protein [Microbacterium sp. 18062]|uniref:hypothetical protein n=1 Tax=Microbacterium sp. 18062 TaxID=2681410 RepID=UPI00135A9DC2|nr:hypothetical protein [Microbacterium sp. 18062]
MTRRAGTPRRSRLAAALLAAGVTLAVLLPAAPAAAIPPDGAGPDTPGTSASVSPRTLEPCQTIGFTVSGYPGGETLYVKIDDGIGYGGESVQGGGVWYMQAIPASGTVSGSFELPCGIAAGSHWLRFLASEEIRDADGAYQGVIGYTRRGGSDFTVVAASGGANADTGTDGSNGSGGSSGRGGAAPAAGTTVGSGSEQVSGQGGVLSIDPGAVETPEPTPTPTATSAPSPTATPVASATSEGTAAGLPVVGLVGAGVLVLAGGGIAAWLLLRRRGDAPAR